MSITSVSYANFRDPWGLARRMLFHRDPIARWTLFEALVGMLMIPLDLGLGLWERRDEHRQMARPSGRSTELPLLLVVGPPRSGSTMVSQLLACHIDVGYFPNICNIFPHAPRTATRWIGTSRAVAQRRSLQSFYGNTSGWRGMSDGFAIWNRWLGSDRYRVSREITDEQRVAMRTFFHQWTTTFGKPLLNKNNRNVDAITLLADILPQAYFIVVQRDPFFIAQSLLHAREFVQGDRRRGWGLYSNDVLAGPLSAGSCDDDVKRREIESVCRQICEIDQRIEMQLKELPTSRFLVLDYCDVCQSPDSAVLRVVNQIPGLRLRESTDLSKLQPLPMANTIRLRADEEAQVRQFLSPHRSRACELT